MADLKRVYTAIDEEYAIENKDQDTLTDKLYIKDIYSNLNVTSEDVEYFVFEPSEATLDSLKGYVEEDDSFAMTAEEMNTYKYIEVTYSPMLKTECSHTDGHFRDGVEYNQNETHCMDATINIGAMLKDGTYTGDDWNYLYFHGGWGSVDRDQDTVSAILYVKDISDLLKISYDEIDYFVFEPSNATLEKVEGYTVANENSYTMSAEELSGYKCLYVTYDVLSQSECGHENHIGDDGKDHGVGIEYCPWAGVSVYAKYTSGGYSGSILVKTEDITKWFVDDEFSATGVAKEAESYIFNGVCSDNFTVTGYDSLPDITLNDGGIGETVIAESNDWDPELGNVPNGKPDLHPTYQAYSLGNNLVYFEGYNAIKFDYTLENKDCVDGIVVILHGWMDDNIGWEMLYYEADESGTVVVDLRDIQDKSYNNIFIGVKAKNSFKIGDLFAPGFKVTNAKMLTSYSGEYSETFTPDPSLEECIDAIDLLFDENEDTVVLSDMELRMIEIVLKNDYGTES